MAAENQTEAVDVVNSNSITLHGIAFTGDDTGGGANIRHAWRAWPGATVVLGIERLDRAGLRRRIEASIQEGRAHLWRMDSPLSIAREHLASQGVSEDWDAMATWMASFPSARDWRRAMRTTDRKELRRVCDRAHTTPLAPTNLRLFKQTWALIAEVAHPLRTQRVRVEPCAGALTSRVVICEANAASILDAAGVPSAGYKGDGNAPRSRRESILTWLRTRNIGISADIALKAAEDTQGDILDALLMTTDPQQTVAPVEASVESWIY